MTHVRYVLGRLGACLQYWPQLAALYLVGLLGRQGAIELAAWAGHDNDVWASLIMPLAGLARLGSFVAMFLVLRPAFTDLAADPSTPRRPVNIFGSVVVPLVAIYLAWQMFKEDWLAFETRALVYRVNEAMAGAAAGAAPIDLHPDTLPVGTTTLVTIGVALLVRTALNMVDDRLPDWFAPVRVYVDFLWVFLALTFSVNKGLTLLISPAAWIKQRRIVVWLDQTRGALSSHLHFLQTGWDAVTAALRVVLGGAVMPLLWLAMAGIVYGISSRADWYGAAHRVGGRWADTVIARTEERRDAMRRRWKSLPRKVREQTREEAVARMGKFKPVGDSARVIAHAGLLGLSLYVLGYLVLAWLDTSGSFYNAQFGPGYLFRGMALLLGPHPIQFWDGVSGALTLVSHLLIEPLRICLVATVFAYCVHHVKASQQ